MTPQEEALQILDKMSELLAVPERWTQRADARDKSGSIITPLAQTATCFCLSGALARFSKMGEPAERIIKRALEKECGTYFWATSWNDAPERTHADVIAALDRAKQIVREGIEK
jgi:hypothetical protein